jgi:hypothetical protein
MSVRIPLYAGLRLLMIFRIPSWRTCTFRAFIDAGVASSNSRRLVCVFLYACRRSVCILPSLTLKVCRKMKLPEGHVVTGGTTELR